METKETEGKALNTAEKGPGQFDLKWSPNILEEKFQKVEDDESTSLLSPQKDILVRSMTKVLEYLIFRGSHGEKEEKDQCQHSQIDFSTWLYLCSPKNGVLSCVVFLVQGNWKVQQCR